jgi:hypothetical protein
MASAHAPTLSAVDSVIDGITDTTDGQTTIRNFVFAAHPFPFIKQCVLLTDATADVKPTDSDKNKALHLGEITVHLYRGRQKQYRVEQDDAADRRHPVKRPRKRTQPAKDERIPEKALKGRAISNHATFGKARVQHSSARPVKSKTRTVTGYPWGRDPIATYTFECRTRKDLQIEGII